MDKKNSEEIIESEKPKSRIGNRRKAVELAWAREQELVKKGLGTVDWDERQQKEIVEDGRATDEDGKAYEGHHMKNVSSYPEYQENPDNIQFLTRNEHLDAHGGNTHVPTNGRYNPKTKTTVDFGEKPPTPCEIIELSNPVYVTKIKKNEKDSAQQSSKKNSQSHKTNSNEKKKSANSNSKELPFTKRIAKTVEDFSTKHRVGITIAKEVGKTVLPIALDGAVKMYTSSKRRSYNKKNSNIQKKSTSNATSNTSPHVSHMSKESDIKHPNRKSPIPHTVRGYEYDRKNGTHVVVPPHPRGKGKKST